MCGIHGFTWKDTGGEAQKMIDAARHRGPDGCGVWRGERITLAHNLLAIADDPDNSRQPWVSGDLVVVFNGEIYNHLDLRKRFTYPWQGQSDTETLAAGLAIEGADFLKRCDGMFALAAYNRTTAELIMARDANGAKPLYYCHIGTGMAFSSEIRSLLAIGSPRKVSREGFRHFYHSGLVAGPLTVFEGIRKLLPGQVCSVNLATRAFSTWNLNDSPPVPDRDPVGMSDPQLAEEIRLRLVESVRLCLSGHRKAALFLSGGMDSTAVLDACCQLGVKLDTYTTRFQLPHGKCRHNDDAHAARDTAAKYGVSNYQVLVTEKAWVADFERAVEALEEPRQGKSFAAYLATNRRMSIDGVVVTFSGDGGDELWAGYKHQIGNPYSIKLLSLRPTKALPDPTLLMTLGEQIEYMDSWLPRGGLTGDLLNDFMYAERLHTLAEDFLVRNDKLGMAFGMEARFPMLCRPFLSLACAVPGSRKSSYLKSAGPDWDLKNKHLLRLAYKGVLPAEVTDKPKTGWRAPTDDWIVGIPSHPAKDRGPAREYLRYLLSDPDVRELFGITEADVEDRYLNNRDFFGPPKPSGKPGIGPGLRSQKELFTAASFAAWLKQFRMSLW